MDHSIGFEVKNENALAKMEELLNQPDDYIIKTNKINNIDKLISIIEKNESIRNYNLPIVLPIGNNKNTIRKTFNNLNTFEKLLNRVEKLDDLTINNIYKLYKNNEFNFIFLLADKKTLTLNPFIELDGKTIENKNLNKFLYYIDFKDLTLKKIKYLKNFNKNKINYVHFDLESKQMKLSNSPYYFEDSIGLIKRSIIFPLKIEKNNMTISKFKLNTFVNLSTNNFSLTPESTLILKKELGGLSKNIIDKLNFGLSMGDLEVVFNTKQKELTISEFKSDIYENNKEIINDKNNNINYKLLQKNILIPQN